jgi:thiol-disulfide isomerase/thioredoxin
VLLLAACGAGENAPAVPRAPAVGDTLPTFRGALVAGDSLSLGDLGGPALINLWATWCPPCRDEIPFLQDLADRYGPQGLRVVGISTDGPRARNQVEAFLADAGVRYPNLLDPQGRSMDLFRVVGLPMTYLVDAGGVITLVRTGPVSESDSAFIAHLDDLVEVP